MRNGEPGRSGSRGPAGQLGSESAARRWARTLRAGGGPHASAVNQLHSQEPPHTVQALVQQVPEDWQLGVSQEQVPPEDPVPP
jgi:hypothetical protein